MAGLPWCDWSTRGVGEGPGDRAWYAGSLLRLASERLAYGPGSGESTEVVPSPYRTAVGPVTGLFGDHLRGRITGTAAERGGPRWAREGSLSHPTLWTYGERGCRAVHGTRNGYMVPASNRLPRAIGTSGLGAMKQGRYRKG
jgi:hypothetical protein